MERRKEKEENFSVVANQLVSKDCKPTSNTQGGTA
jgi:hypothetical protein